MSVGRSVAGEVDTRRTVILRPWASRWILLGAALQVFGQLIVLAGALTDHELKRHAVGMALTLTGAACWVVLWALVRVRVQPSGLVMRQGATRRTVRWDEVDAVRLESRRSIAKLDFYGPLLELHSGQELFVTELFGPVRARRLQRSLPARHVKIISSYLDHYRPPGHR